MVQTNKTNETNQTNKTIICFFALRYAPCALLAFRSKSAKSD